MKQSFCVLAEYLEWSSISADSTNNVLFRGENSKSYDLLPLAWRNPLYTREVLIDNLYGWAEQASTIRDGIKDLHFLDLMSLAQHYGFPTFFLDWTTNPLVALFFAIKDVKKESQGEYVSVHRFIPDNELTIKNNLRHERQRDESLISIYRPPAFDVRIKVQSGLFTYHDSIDLDMKKMGLYDVPSAFRNTNILNTFDIPKHIASDLRNKLLALGINDYFVMPDLDGLSEHYKYLMYNSPRGSYIKPKNSISTNYSELLTIQKLERISLP